jgi:hypothetical protein
MSEDEFPVQDQSNQFLPPQQYRRRVLVKQDFCRRDFDEEISTT